MLDALVGICSLQGTIMKITVYTFLSLVTSKFSPWSLIPTSSKFSRTGKNSPGIQAAIPGSAAGHWDVPQYALFCAVVRV